MKFRSRLNDRWAGAAVLTGMLLVAGACGTSSGESDVGVASLSDNAESAPEEADTATADTAVEAPDNPEDAFALFNECMTETGFGFGGGISISVSGGGAAPGGVIEVEPGGTVLGDDELDPQQQDGSFEDFDPEAFDKARETCEGHLANIDNGFDMTPEQQAAFEDAQLEWSECMRDQGVDVPEFDGSGGPGLSVGVIEGPADGADPQSGTPSFDDFDFDFEAFGEAAEICQSVYEQFDELDGLFDEDQANG